MRNVNSLTASAAIMAFASNPKPAPAPAAANAGTTAPAAANTDTPAPAAATADAGKPKRGANGPRTAPELTAVSGDVPMPERANKRGSKSLYPFDNLTAVGQSFGIKNKTAKGIASIVSNQNKKYVEPRKDANGNVIFKTTEMKAADGSVTRVPTNEPETETTKEFFAADVDPTKDPNGASVRVWRRK